VLYPPTLTLPRPPTFLRAVLRLTDRLSSHPLKPFVEQDGALDIIDDAEFDNQGTKAKPVAKPHPRKEKVKKAKATEMKVPPPLEETAKLRMAAFKESEAETTPVTKLQGRAIAKKANADLKERQKAAKEKKTLTKQKDLESQSNAGIEKGKVNTSEPMKGTAKKIHVASGTSASKSTTDHKKMAADTLTPKEVNANKPHGTRDHTPNSKRPSAGLGPVARRAAKNPKKISERHAKAKSTRKEAVSKKDG